MKIKKCFKCGKEKPLSEFYVHKQMGDGHLNKCKECTRADVKKRYDELSQFDEFLEKERERGREKYHRLGYKETQKENSKKYKFRKRGKFANVHRYLKLLPEQEAHHWNYNNGYEYDVFILTRKQHKRAHAQMVIDLEYLMYRDKDMNLLDTREKHEQYISQFIDPF